MLFHLAIRLGPMFPPYMIETFNRVQINYSPIVVLEESVLRRRQLCALRPKLVRTAQVGELPSTQHQSAA